MALEIKTIKLNNKDVKMEESTLFISLADLAKASRNNPKPTLQSVELWEAIEYLSQSTLDVVGLDQKADFYYKEKLGIRVRGSINSKKYNSIVPSFTTNEIVNYRKIAEKFPSLIEIKPNGDFFIELRVALRFLPIEYHRELYLDMILDGYIVDVGLDKQLDEVINNLSDAHPKGENTHRVIQIKKRIREKVLGEDSKGWKNAKTWNLYDRDRVLTDIIKGINLGIVNVWDDIKAMIENMGVTK